MSTVPESALPRCVDCYKPVDVDNPLALIEVIGFAKRRAAGGQNHVWHRTETGRWLCPRCSNRRSLGLPVEQEALL